MRSPRSPGAPRWHRRCTSSPAKCLGPYSAAVQSAYNFAGVNVQQARIGARARVVDLLRLNTFRDARVRAGEDGLRRSITGVTVGEVPDQERFLRGGELSLTSLYAYRAATADALRLFVETIDDHGAAALAFKPGRFVPDLPALVLHTANERSLPLVALRADVVWSDVISEVSSLLLSRAGAELATILTVEAELADA